MDTDFHTNAIIPSAHNPPAAQTKGGATTVDTVRGPQPQPESAANNSAPASDPPFSATEAISASGHFLHSQIFTNNGSTLSREQDGNSTATTPLRPLVIEHSPSPAVKVFLDVAKPRGNFRLIDIYV